jgi:hypothetical protein
VTLYRDLLDEGGGSGQRLVRVERAGARATVTLDEPGAAERLERAARAPDQGGADRAGRRLRRAGRGPDRRGAGVLRGRRSADDGARRGAPARRRGCDRRVALDPPRVRWRRSPAHRQRHDVHRRPQRPRRRGRAGLGACLRSHRRLNGRRARARLRPPRAASRGEYELDAHAPARLPGRVRVLRGRPPRQRGAGARDWPRPGGGGPVRARIRGRALVRPGDRPAAPRARHGQAEATRRGRRRLEHRARAGGVRRAQLRFTTAPFQAAVRARLARCSS